MITIFAFLPPPSLRLSYVSSSLSLCLLSFFCACVCDGYVSLRITWEPVWARKGVWQLKSWYWMSESSWEKMKYPLKKVVLVVPTVKKICWCFFLDHCDSEQGLRGKMIVLVNTLLIPEKNWIEGCSTHIKGCNNQRLPEEPDLLFSFWTLVLFW